MPAFEVYEKSQAYLRLPTSRSFAPAKRLILRSITLVLCAIVAMIVPKFGLFINLVGAFACTALAFVMPVYIYNTTFKEEITLRRRYFHYFLVLFGCIAGSIATVVSVYDLIDAFAHQEEAEKKEEIIDVSKTDVQEIDLNAPTAQANPVMRPGPNHFRF